MMLVSIITPFIVLLKPGMAASISPNGTTQQLTQQSAIVHQTLQKSLLKQLAAIKEREDMLQHASSQEAQTKNKLHILKMRQKSIQHALAQTQQKLDLMEQQQEKLDHAATILYQKQIDQALHASLLLPAASYLHDNIDMPLFFPSVPLDAPPTTSSSQLTTKEDTILALSLLQAQAIFAQKKAARLEAARLAVLAHIEEIKQNQTDLEQNKKNEITEKTQNAALTDKTETIHHQAEQTFQDAQKLLEDAKRNAASLNDEITHLASQEAEKTRKLTEKAKELARTNPKNAEIKHISQQIDSLHTGKGIGRGHGAAPVNGTLFTKWGQKTDNGDTATGLTYKTPPSAAVYAPCNGHLLYTGQFRSFGLIIILDCGHQQRFVLSGLGKITTQTGQSVQLGQILGKMPEEGGLLFLQLHHGKNLLDPTPYLTSSKALKNTAREKNPPPH